MTSILEKVNFIKRMDKEKLLSVADVSRETKISRQRVLQIIENGDLEAEMVGRNYVIRQSDFEDWNSSRREAGRPRKIAKIHFLFKSANKSEIEEAKSYLEKMSNSHKVSEINLLEKKNEGLIIEIIFDNPVLENEANGLTGAFRMLGIKFDNAENLSR